MDYLYDWKFSRPDECVDSYEELQELKVEFILTLSMERREMNSREMKKILFEYPVMTLSRVGLLEHSYCG